MSPRTAGLLVSVLTVLAPAAPAAAAKPSAPGAPGAHHSWAPADKHGFGTAHELTGHAYFTLRQASLSEVYYPDLSTPALRGLQFAVTDGKKVLDREVVDDDPRHIEPVAPGVRATVTPLARTIGFRQVTENGRWRLTKTWITDPARDSVLLKVRFESKTRKALQLYVLADGAPGNDGNDDRGISGDTTLVAYDESAASAVAASPVLTATSSGYKNTASDPWQDLQDDKALTGYDATQAGNVVQGARTALDGIVATDMTLAIGFGRDATAATAAATGSLGGSFAAAQAAYDAGWSSYLDSLNAPPAPAAAGEMKRLYEQSLLVLAASEDKLNRGASIASPTMPWIWGTLTLAGESQISGPYHLVWPRDFYHAATAQKAAGDDAAADRLVDYLWRVQKSDGSFWQNTTVAGKEFWTTEQLDETALPVVLAWWLGRTGATDWTHVRAAAEYLVANGPRSDQERWENQDGYSPNTIATEIAALVCAADIARRNGVPSRANAYEKLADEWQSKVQSWTATDNGPYSPRPYYLRVTKDANPNAATKYRLGDNHLPLLVDQREIVDNSFLGLVLFGVKRWNDRAILNSLQVGDSTSAEPLLVKTPNGEFWRRFTFDGYGEQADGGDWDLFFDKENNQTFGRGWPLLAGERGEYELIAGKDASARLKAIAGSANDGMMLPEQVWDGRPPTAEPAGEGTRSATPLAWTHAQFVRLAWSIQAGEPIERPSIVACRYQKELCP